MSLAVGLAVPLAGCGGDTTQFTYRGQPVTHASEFIDAADKLFREENADEVRDDARCYLVSLDSGAMPESLQNTADAHHVPFRCGPLKSGDWEAYKADLIPGFMPERFEIPERLDTTGYMFKKSDLLMRPDGLTPPEDSIPKK